MLISKRSWPVLLSGFFVAITVHRVADYIDGGWVSWAFSVGLAMCVFASAFYLGYKDTRLSAASSLIFFIFADGVFNVAEVINWSIGAGRWDTTVTVMGFGVSVYRFTDVLYGLFPTAATGLLGWLSRDAARIPAFGKKTIWGALQDLLMVAISDEQPVSRGSTPAKESPKEEDQADSVWPKVEAYLDSLSPVDEDHLPSIRKIAAEVECSYAVARKHRIRYAKDKFSIKEDEDVKADS